MIKSLRLGNFKAFGDTQTIPIRPLTLIFGANSSGKSSIIHGLLFAQNALAEDILDPHRMNISGDSVDLGGFRQFVHRKETDRRVTWGMDFDTAQFKGRLAELLQSSKNVSVNVQIGISKGSPEQDDEQKEQPPRVILYELVADGETLMGISRRGAEKMQVDFINTKHPLVRMILSTLIESWTTTQSITEDEYAALVEAVNALVPLLTARADKLLVEQLFYEKTSRQSLEEYLLPISKENRKQELMKAVETYLPRILNDVVHNLYLNASIWMQDVLYLGPLRSYPPRHLAFAQYHDPNWQAGGGYAWDVVRRDQKVRDAVNKWLGAEFLQTPYELSLARLINPNTLGAFLQISKSLEESAHPDILAEINAYQIEEENVGEFIAKVITNLSGPEVEGIPELVLKDKRTETVVSHRDVGIGISQVLPVLVSAYGNTNSVVAIEQPEIHLHPALQAELGDVFIESALGERRNTFLLETHSEHLILRILRRIRESSEKQVPDITPNDVQVLYVQPGSNGSTVIPLDITPDGDFAQKWPGGFFAERAEELF